MKAVVQRVSEAKIFIEGKYKGKIGKGIVVFIGIGKGDTEENAEYLAKKILSLRIFENKNGKMDYSVLDINGEIMVVSQFTLYGDCKKGNRPDFTSAEKGQKAEKIFNFFVEKIKEIKKNVISGEFGKKMLVEIHNEGPCTIIMER